MMNANQTNAKEVSIGQNELKIIEQLLDIGNKSGAYHMDQAFQGFQALVGLHKMAQHYAVLIANLPEGDAPMTVVKGGKSAKTE